MLLVGCGVATLVLSRARRSPRSPAESWKPQQSLTPQAGPDPSLPGGPQNDVAAGRWWRRRAVDDSPTERLHGLQPDGHRTCLDTVSAVAVLPGDGDPIALVGERRTGRILRVRKGQDPVVVATLRWTRAPTAG